MPRKKKQSFSAYDIVRTVFDGQQIEAIVVACDGRNFIMRPFGPFATVNNGCPVAMHADALTLVHMNGAEDRPPAVDNGTRLAATVLMGRTIQNVRYLTDEELETMGWTSNGVVLELDSGHMVYAVADNDCSKPGALFIDRLDQPHIVLPAVPTADT